MIGRSAELQLLEDLYHTDGFSFLILYGRRRVGKTTLLNAFRGRHQSIFFPAQEKNDALNLEEFSEAIQAHYGETGRASFRSWKDALQYISSHTTNDRTVLIIDEFPYLTVENASVKSTFQHIIDHEWKKQNIFLILCGSSISAMEKDVLGAKSPLYGRSTAQMELMPFDYLDSANFFSRYTPEQKLTAYMILGGIPRYLEEFDDRESVENNIGNKILARNAFLHEEPQAFLRMEVREPVRYNSILEAVSEGINRGKLIADRLHEEQTTLNKYLHTLKTIRLIQRIVPCGEKEESKRGIHIISDPFFCFWYRFEFSNRTRYDLMGNQAAAKEIISYINDYCGMMFERVCTQYMIRLAKGGMLPFIPHDLGRWWGNNPVLKEQDDVDILGLDKAKTKGIFCECKFRNQKFRMEDLDNLKRATEAFPNVKEKYYYLFSKSGFTAEVETAAKEEGIVLVTPREMYRL